MRYAAIERFGSVYRLIVYKHPPSHKEPDEPKKQHPEGERFESSVIRAKSRVRELALCNEWQYFATFTLDKEKQDRHDLSAWVKALGNWVGNYNKKYAAKLQYIIIPEQHKDGAWHAHGLLRGVADASLQRNEHGYLDMPYYAKRFGYISLSPIKNAVAVSHYITKYITKDFSSAARKKDEHLFYSSRGLAGKEPCLHGYIPDDFACDYENEHCGVTWIKAEDFELFDIRGLLHDVQQDW